MHPNLARRTVSVAIVPSVSANAKPIPANVELLLGHTKLESTVRYLGIEVDDALEMAEQTEGVTADPGW